MESCYVSFMKNLINYILPIIIFTFYNMSFALAESDLGPSQSGSQFSIGFAYINGDSIYSDGESKSRIVPYLSFESERIRASVQEGLTYQLMDTPNLSFDVSLSPNFKPYESQDAPSLVGMKREMTFDGSISSSYEITRGLTAKIKLTTEVTNEFKGTAADLSISQFIPISGIPIIFKAGSSWYDENRAKYFYGVYESEATDLREQYDPGPVLIPYFAISSFYNLTPKASLFGTVSSTMFPDKIESSPVVEKELSVNVVIGMGYKF